MRRVVLFLFVLLTACTYSRAPVPHFWRHMPEDQRIWGGGPTEVVVPPPILDSLGALWEEADSVEFAACLEGDVEGRAVWVDGERRPNDFAWFLTDVVRVDLVETSRTSAKMPVKACDAFPGRVHSHPGGTCNRSLQDLRSFWLSQYQFEVVMCGPESYRWYTANGEQGGQGDWK